MLGIIKIGLAYQQPTPPPTAINRPVMPTVLYGAAYYQENELTDRLADDIKLTKQAESTVVCMGESTWSLWEPYDGHFE